MGYPTVSDVRQKLGERYSNWPDNDTIQSFIDRRIAQVEERVGQTFQGDPPQPIFIYVLNYACADVISMEISGNGAPISYKIGDQAVDKKANVEAKLNLIQQLIDEAERELRRYLQPQYFDYTAETSLLFKRGSP